MKKEKYLDAIYNLIIEVGFDTLRMEEIAEKIGITKMTLYNNFTNKQVLYKAIVSYRSTKFLEFIDSVSVNQHNAIDELMAVLEFQHKNPFPELPTFYLSFLRANPRVFNLYKARFRRILKIFIVNNINRGIKEGVYLSTIDAENIATFSINTMENMMDKWLNSDMKMDLNSVHDNIITYHIRGIANAEGLRILEKYSK